MSTRNSTFYQNLAVPFDHPVTSLSISPLGNEVVLAAKRGLYILDLEDPFAPPKTLNHFSKWFNIIHIREVVDVQWNPHPSKANWIASTSNLKALVWDISRGSNDYIQFILTKHLRAVSDIHWSPFRPELLATCSYDAYIHLWDLRQRTDRPSNSFCAWTVGANQVKFNRINEWVLASSHDTDVRIWDIRKGSSPTSIITAHMTKIYGIDWSRKNETELVTCSQDQLVKFWDTCNPQICQKSITTGAPVWRARFTPFGNAIVTMAQRRDNNLHIWSLDNMSTPVHTFSGHLDTPTEFVWRYQRNPFGSDPHPESDFQLITWSKDMHLRLWSVSRTIAKAVGHEFTDQETIVGTEPEENPSIVAQPQRALKGILRNFDKNQSDESPDRTPTMKYLEDVKRAQQLFPSVTFESIDSGVFVVSLQSDGRTDPHSNIPTALLRVEVKFHNDYPLVPPIFALLKTGMMSLATRNSINNRLNQIASVFSEKGEPCLVPCIRYLLGEPFPSAVEISPITRNNAVVGSLESVNSEISDRHAERPIALQDGSYSETSSSDLDGGFFGLKLKNQLGKGNIGKEASNVPFPCLTGARFSPTGKLVIFYSPLPHPSSSNFSAFTLTTRNQQPILQSQRFLTQPKTYPLYDNYRNFLLQTPKEAENTPEIQIGENKVEHWADEDDADEDIINLVWSPNPAGKLIRPEKKEWIKDDEMKKDARRRRKSVSTISSSLSERDWGDQDIFSRAKAVPSRRSSPDILRAGSPGRSNSPQIRTPASSPKKLVEMKLSRSHSGRSTPLGPNLPKNETAGTITPTPGKLHVIDIVDLEWLFPFSKLTAKSFTYASLIYRLKGSSKKQICIENSIASTKLGRTDLTQIWQFLYLLISDDDDFNESHDLFKVGLDSLFDYLYSVGNIQMISMIAALLTNKQVNSNKDVKQPKSPKRSGPRSPIPRTWSVDRNLSGVSDKSTSQRISSYGKLSYKAEPRFNIYHPSSLVSRPSTVSLPAEEKDNSDKFEISVLKVNDNHAIERCQHEITSQFSTLAYHNTIQIYANHLYSWEMFEQRQELLSHTLSQTSHTGLIIHPTCTICFTILKKQEGGLFCQKCLKYKAGIKCSICQLNVKGLLWFCKDCYHGGHFAHMKEWFHQNDSCPLGCGCNCWP